MSNLHLQWQISISHPSSKDHPMAHLICGFYCPTQQTQACLLGVVLFGAIDYLIAPELVWSDNQDRPVQIDTTLQLTGDGDLILHDANGTFAWSTNTSGKSVFGMNFTELGNLALFDQNNATVWYGHKLTSSKSTSNLTPGLFSFKVQDYYKMVGAYVESNPPLPYFKSYVGVKYVKFKKESFLGHKILVASLSSPHHQFIRLDLDGHLKAYEWDGWNWNWNWNVTADLMTSDIGDCGYPMVCGNYGICSSNGQCSCQEEAIYNNTFWQINSRQPSLGCSLVTPISCDHSKYHTLLELKNTKKSPTTQNLIPSAINSPQKKSGQSEDFDEFFVDQVPGMPTRFSYEELRAMTSNFNDKLGEEGFGPVFQGTLSDGTKVAVKRLNGFGQVKKSILPEAETIGSIHQVNLVRLNGFCAEKSYRLLVYEYMSNGSLDTWIFQRH
ncbi:unnamed protein product [Camellia sinensis]